MNEDIEHLGIASHEILPRFKGNEIVIPLLISVNSCLSKEVHYYPAIKKKSNTRDAQTV
jgi:hypothetical protein